MKQRILSCLMALVLVFGLIPWSALPVHAAQIVDQGQCGDAVYWKLDDTGTLTVYGEGPMYDYDFDWNIPSPGTPYEKYRYEIKSVAIEPGVTAIGSYSFSSMAIESVKMADTVEEIHGNAFFFCPYLSDITFSKNLKSIGRGAFAQPDDWYTQFIELELPDSLEFIGYAAFGHNIRIRKLHIPQNVETIESGAFYQLLPGAIQLAPGEQNYRLDDYGALIDVRSKELLYVPALPLSQDNLSREEEVLDNLASEGFEVPDTYQTYQVPDGVETIGIEAFRECRQLSEILIPASVHTIGDCAFQHCRSLTNIEFSDSVHTIGVNVFLGCPQITEVVIPASVTQISEVALSGIKYNYGEMFQPERIIFQGSAPEILPDPSGDTYPVCYNLDGVEIYYPKDDPSWTDSTKLRFAPDAHWKAVAMHNWRLEARSRQWEQTIDRDTLLELEFSLFDGDEAYPIESYSISISDPDILKSVDNRAENGKQILTFKALKDGVVHITFTDGQTETSTTVGLEIVGADDVYRCSTVPQPVCYGDHIYIENYNCEEHSDGTHSVTFDAYNTSHAYGVAAVYDESDRLIQLVPLSPLAEGSGTELIANGFRWVWEDIVDLFDGESDPEYRKGRVSQLTNVELPNLPENSRIVVTVSGKEDAHALIYTGVDTFVRVVLAANSVDFNMDTQNKTVEELMQAILEKLLQKMEKEEAPGIAAQTLANQVAVDLASAASKGLSADSIQEIYGIIEDLCKDLTIDPAEIMQSALEGILYDVGDTILLTVVPEYFINMFVDQVNEIGWPILDASFAWDSAGSTEIKIDAHGTRTAVSDHLVTVSQDAAFGSDTVLEVAKLEEEEIQELNCEIPEELVSYQLYNITLQDKGVEIQPDGDIQVKVPAPEGAKAKQCVVYRMESDHSLTELESTCEDGYLTFETDHLSYYLVGQTKPFPLAVVGGVGAAVVLLAVVLMMMRRKKSA